MRTWGSSHTPDILPYGGNVSKSSTGSGRYFSCECVDLLPEETMGFNSRASSVSYSDLNIPQCSNREEMRLYILIMFTCTDDVTEGEFFRENSSVNGKQTSLAANTKY